MSDEFQMGRTGQKAQAQQKALTGAVAAGADSVSAAEKSLAKVTKSFKEQAKVLVAQANSALIQLQELDQEGGYSEMAGVVQSFEDDNVEALTALKSHVKGREGMTLSQVVILVENVREVGRIASRL